MEHDGVPRELRPFLNDRGQLTALPAKHRKKLLAIYYLAGRFAPGRSYTEAEVNDLLDDWTAFHDPATLRRELFNHFLLNRTPDGSRYWAAEAQPPLEEFIARYI